MSTLNHSYPNSPVNRRGNSFVLLCCLKLPFIFPRSFIPSVFLSVSLRPSTIARLSMGANAGNRKREEERGKGWGRGLGFPRLLQLINKHVYSVYQQITTRFFPVPGNNTTTKLEKPERNTLGRRLRVQYRSDPKVHDGVRIILQHFIFSLCWSQEALTYVRTTRTKY